MQLTATIFTCVWRRIDGCNSNAAVAAIGAAVSDAIRSWENKHDATVLFDYDPDTSADRECAIHCDCSDNYIALGYERSLRECIGNASDKAIQEGEWIEVD